MSNARKESDGLKKSLPKKVKNEKGQETVPRKKVKTGSSFEKNPPMSSLPISSKLEEPVVREEERQTENPVSEKRTETEQQDPISVSETGQQGEEEGSSERDQSRDQEAERNPSDQKVESPDKPLEESVTQIYQEYYLNGYCLRNDSKEQFYAKDNLGNETYWRDSVNAEIYAYKDVEQNGTTRKIEYPAKVNNEPQYIYDRAGKPRYPVDLNTHHVLFPRNPVTNEEMYLTDRMGFAFYPENKFGEQFYCKDAQGNDVVINNMYAQYATGSQKYPRKSNGDQYYLQLDNKEMPAVKVMDGKRVPYYAEKLNGDQIYPRLGLQNQ